MDAELTRHPVDRECTTCVAVVAVVGCYWPFHAAVVVESGAVARGRREDAPTSRPSRRPRADPGVVRKLLLMNWRELLALL